MKVFYPPYSRDQLIALLRERVSAFGDVLPLRQMTLFGSWASGRATAFSDIDLLVIYKGATRADAYELIRRLVALRGLEPHVYSEAEAESMGDMLDRMTAGGVPLFPATAPV